jgi:hypothetical protein
MNLLPPLKLRTYHEQISGHHIGALPPGPRIENGLNLSRAKQHAGEHKRQPGGPMHSRGGARFRAAETARDRRPLAPICATAKHCFPSSSPFSHQAQNSSVRVVFTVMLSASSDRTKS